tara:strand:+ start:354 stop:611 length:258 start_codon:yes stop_codon:yes gene_type:complete
MSTPSKKSLEMNEFLEIFSKKMSEGVGRAASIARNTCTTCKGDASTFTDELSEKEFTISGMCQTCQDEIFTDPQDEDLSFFYDNS